MKAVLASILALLLISASLGAGVHAAGYQPSADVLVQSSDEEQEFPGMCCDAAEHEMSGSFSALTALAPASGSAVPPEPLQRFLRPATTPPGAGAEPEVLRWPPRTL